MSPPATAAVPSVAEIDRIAALPDLVLRNLLITQTYHELSAALAGLLGAAANWCTFAVWASKQAGQTIRNEDARRLLDLELDAAFERSPVLRDLAAAVLDLGARFDPLGLRGAAREALHRAAPFARTSAAVSQGNTLVFAEIAREFARFLAELTPDPALDAEKVARFCERLRPGDPPGGQGFLRRAFAHLAAARFAATPEEKAEQLLLVCLEIGFHEQTRLQPVLVEALEAGLPGRDELRRHLLAALGPRLGFVLRLRLRLPRVMRRTGPLDRALDRLADELRAVVRRVVTSLLTRIELPDGQVLRLGRDLRLRFPAFLDTVADAELLALLARIDPTPDSLAGSGAEDWADFAERMHYLADFFRGFQGTPALLGPPFTAEQVAALRAGGKPVGRL